MIFEVSLYGGMDLRVITFQAEDVVGFMGNEFASDGFLAAHGVDADNRPLYVDSFQESRNRFDFIVFSSTACCPIANPRSVAQALTICSGPRFACQSCDRR